MKRIMLAMTACLLATPALAGDWMANTQDLKDGVWSGWGYSSMDNYMDYVIGDCHAAMIIKPHAVKIRFANGEEKLFLCDEVRAEHPL